MRNRSRQNGYLLVTMIITLFMVASIAVLLTHRSSISANTATRELETARAEYVAQAGMQHAIWRAGNNVCMGDVMIPATSLGADSYTATVSGAASGTNFVLNADQDAWIRSDDPDKNNGASASNHVRSESGSIEQVLTRFDVSSVPASSQVNSAIAWFHLKAGKEHPEGRITIHEINEDWDEATVTWNSFGAAFGNGSIGVIPAQDTGNVWVAVNLTGAVQAWVNGQPNNGILFASTAEGLHTEYTAREDGTHPPRLEVTIGSGQASPVVIKSVGTLQNGISRSRQQTPVTAYQPPATTVLQPGADGKDNWVSSNNSFNYGVAGEMTLRGDANPEHFLIQFPIERVPSGSRVVSARMDLYLNWLASTDPTAEFSVHRMNRQWTEGTGDNWNPGDGATWSTSNGINAWDWASNHDTIATATTTVDPSYSGWHSWDITNLVQRWVSGDHPNYGLVVKGNAATVDAWFRSSDYIDPAQHPRLTIEYACECGTPCLAPNGTGRIALIGDDWTPDPDDQLKIEIIESWGYEVDFYQDRDSGGIDWSNYDLAYVSETSVSGDVNADLRSLTIGVINEEPALYDNLQLASGDTNHVGSSINITDNSHFITSVFAKGPLPIYTGGMQILTADTPLAAGLQTLAQFNGAATLTATERDAETIGGTAAGRRVTLPLGQHFAGGFDWKNLNQNGHLLVQRAIEWGIGDASDTLRILFVVGISHSLQARDTGRRDLFESWGHTVTIIDDGAAQGEFDAEFALHDIVYVGGTVVDGVLAEKLTKTSLGIVNEVGGQLDDLGFHGNAIANTVTTDSFTATDAGHYISSPFSGAGVTHFTRNIAMPVASTPMAPNLREVAALGALTWAIPVLQQGATRWDGNPSPGRRVHLPFGEARVSQLTDDGTTLLRRTLEWAGGAGPQYGLIAHWKLDEGAGLIAADAVGGHDGTLENGPAWAAGAVEGGVRFSDESHAITVQHSDSLTITGDFSLLAWVNLDELKLNRPIVQKGTNNINHNYYLGLSEDNIQFAVSPPEGGWHVKTSGATGIAPGTWHHIAVSFDDSADEVAFYLDGALFSTQPLTHSPGEFAGPVRIGRNDNNYGFKGRIDDVRIYRDALGAAEIAEIADRPPAAHWKLDETSGTTAVDSEGGHDGTAVNTEWVTGVLDGGLRLNSSADRVEVPHDEALSFTNALTVSAWINKAGMFGYDGAVVKATTGSDVNYFLGTWESNPVFGFSTSSDNWQGYYATGTTLLAGEWYHLAASYDNEADSVRIYVDGSLAQSFTSTLEPVTNTGNVFLGRSAIGEHWPGLLDDVRIYPRALSDQEIADLAVPGGGAIAHWQLDDGSGTTAIDSVGGHDGSLANGPQWVTGYLGDALRFDGSNDRINVPHDNGLNLAGEMTLSAWIYSDNLSGFHMVLTKGDNGVAENYWLGTDGDGVNFGFVDGGTYAQHTTSGLSLQTGRWHHIAATFDDAADEVKLYVDGSAETFTSTYSPSANTERLIIGNSYYSGEGFDGQIDDVRIYDRVLATSEIAALAAESGGGGGGGGGGNCVGTFRDEFNAISYAGSDGTEPWATNWLEINENGNVNNGDERVVDTDSNYHLQVRDNDGGGEGVQREADLSEFSTATFSFEYRRDGFDNTNDYVMVHVSRNGGASWTELDRFRGPGTDSSYVSESYDISSYISSNTRIRFLTSPYLGSGDEMYFDNVEIAATGCATP